MPHRPDSQPNATPPPLTESEITLAEVRAEEAINKLNTAVEAGSTSAKDAVRRLKTLASIHRG